MADIERARQLRKKETWAEKLVWRWLRDRRFSGYKFRRHIPSVFTIWISFVMRRN
jgi:very-short-patch-repair endonuclease